jgi:hypothetical protein
MTGTREGVSAGADGRNRRIHGCMALVAIVDAEELPTAGGRFDDERQRDQAS